MGASGNIWRGESSVCLVGAAMAAVCAVPFSIFIWHLVFGKWVLRMFVYLTIHSTSNWTSPHAQCLHMACRVKAWQWVGKANVLNCLEICIVLAPGAGTTSGELKLASPHSFIAGQHLWHIVSPYDGMGSNNNNNNKSGQTDKWCVRSLQRIAGSQMMRLMCFWP